MLGVAEGGGRIREKQKERACANWAGSGRNLNLELISGRETGRSSGCCCFLHGEVRHCCANRRRKSGLVRKNGLAANRNAKEQNYAVAPNSCAEEQSSFAKVQSNCVEAQSNSAEAGYWNAAACFRGLN